MVLYHNPSFKNHLSERCRFQDAKIVNLLFINNKFYIFLTFIVYGEKNSYYFSMLRVWGRVCLHYVCGQYHIPFINKTPISQHEYLAIGDSHKSQYPLSHSHSNARCCPTKPYPSILWVASMYLYMNL